MQKRYLWKVFPKHANLKLLAFLKECTNTSISNRALKRIVEKGFCMVNGKVELFASTSLRVGDTVELDSNWEKSTDEKKSLSIPILYEDDDLIIVDKPSGTVCEDKIFHDALSQNVTLVHRLDKGTSGVLILAKSEKIKEKMIPLFEEKSVKKSYLAIVDGRVSQHKGKIESYLRKKNTYQGQSIWGSSDKGLLATTLYEVIKKEKNVTLLLCHPITGRTHQLRVHLLELGHPILGDFHYCKKFSYTHYVDRLMLHSWKIEFIHPVTSKKIFVESKIPKEFYGILDIPIS